MSTWGPQATGGVAPPLRVRKGGGWMWMLPILWALTIPLWLVGLIVAASPPVDIECPSIDPSTGVVPDCPARGEAIASQLATYGTVLLVTVAATCLVALLIGLSQGRRGVGIMYGRTALIVMTVLIAVPQLIAYLAGYGLGRIRPARPKATSSSGTDVESYKTEAHWLMERPDTVAAITEIVESKTGHRPGAVLGWSLDGTDSILTATPRGGVLVLGPPGSGKTSAVLIPTVMIAPGACVSSSIKSDVMNATWRVRAQRGRVWHFDPGGDEVTPEGVERVRWSPLASVRTWDDALQVGKSMGDAQRTKGREDHFIGRAIDWVQTLLYAAHLDGKSIATVARWAASALDDDTSAQVLGILADAADDGDEGADIAWQKLKGLIATPDKERGSIVSTMARMLGVYDSLAARRIGENPNFDPREFVRSADTLYITARPDKQDLYAPLLAALLEQIRFETYDRTKREQAGLERSHPHVTFALDEANTTAPIPLPAIISEAGGQGLHLAVGIQALGPAIARWGDAAKSFLTLFPTKVIFRGVFDQDTVSALSDAAGEYDRHMTSYSVSTSYVGPYLMPLETVNPSYQTQRQKVLTPGDITAIPAGRALIWDGPAWGIAGIGMHWNAGVWQTVATQAQHAAATLQLRQLNQPPHGAVT